MRFDDEPVSGPDLAELVQACRQQVAARATTAGDLLRVRPAAQTGPVGF